MSKIALASFGGEVRAPDPKLLADAVGTLSQNNKPGRGDLRPWRQPLTTAVVPSSSRTIYRMGRDVPSASLYWLSWNTIVHAIHGFVSADTSERTYFTGDGAPKQTNNVLAVAAAPYPAASRDLGVPVPAAMPIVSVLSAGVATDTDLRYYVYTYVTDWGDESAPSPVSAAFNGKTDTTVTIENLEAPPSGTHGINRIRVYRTQSGADGTAEFFFLRELPSTAGSTTDDLRQLGEVMPTDGWLPPPANLTFLTAMWNGMAAAIVPTEGSVRYCIAYKPYAWPIALETLPPNAKAVALATFGQRLLVLTTGKPVLVTGSGPESLDSQPLEIMQSCVAPQSAVGMGHGVVWACPDGLAYYGESGAKLLTNGLMTRDDWQAMNPASIIGGVYEGAYFGIYTVAGVKRAFLIDPLAPTGMFFLDEGYDALFFDEAQDSLFVLKNGAIQKWDAGTAFMQARFRSKQFVSGNKNFAAARMEASVYPVELIVDMVDVKAAEVAAMVAARPALYSAPTPNTLRYTVSVADDEPFTLPGDIEARTWQFQINTFGPVQWLLVASSMTALAQE